MSNKALTAGAENISKQLIQQLNTNNIIFEYVAWKNGKEFYVLSGLCFLTPRRAFFLKI